MDLKESNILISNSGRISISNFKRSYNLRTITMRCYLDFLVDLDYAAPENKYDSYTSTKVDVWSLGVLSSRLLSICIPAEPKKSKSFGIENICLI